MHSLELKVPPPVVVLTVGLLMWLAARHAPAFAFAIPATLRASIALALSIGGVGLGVAGALAFRRARTTINPLLPGTATTLVQSGIYRFSRNPIYVGDLLVLLGWGIWSSNVVSVLLAALFVVYMNRFQIQPEERALAALFGAAYDEYRANVRRWA